MINPRTIVDKQEIIGVYEDERVSFSDVSGKLILSGLEEEFTSEVFCSFSDSDFFVINSGGKTKILNRNLKTFYSRKGTNYIEDIGMGIIKISHDEVSIRE